MIEGEEGSLLIRGDAVTADGIARDRFILARGGRITEISRRRPPRTDGIPLIETRRGDWIFPGLINLHTHSTYNFLPLWRSPDAPFDNRFEWRRNEAYKREVSQVARDLAKGEGMREAIGVFGELQAVAGGTAVLQEDFALDSEKKLGGLLLCRDTASASDFGLSEDKLILSVVDFFRPGSDNAPAPVADTLDRYRKARDDGTLAATIVHLAEGRSGFGSNRGADPYSRLEFEAFMQLPEMADAAAVRGSPLALVHGCGIDPRDSRHMQFLRDRAISIVWSPVSNMLLYGDTIDVETLRDEGINVALGSDWAPSGSKHVWEEAKFARAYFDAIGSPVPDELLFEMVTTNAARCLGMDHIGRIREGALADFFILRSPIETDNPHEVFLGTDDRHVLATIIGGRPIYGDRETLAPFSQELQPLPAAEGSAVRNKAVRLPPQLEFDVDARVSAIEAALKALQPPIKRSNLLASSDKPYRRRIQFLRGDLERFGWGVRTWRHDGPSPTAGAVPVAPDAVQLWRGYRAPDRGEDEFVAQLGSTLIPFAVAAQAPLGLTALLRALLPQTRPAGVPDEIALVFFETREAAARSRDSAGGRACDLVNDALFDHSRSSSDFPERFAGTLALEQPVYLFEGKADWQRGASELFVGSRPAGVTPEGFLAAVAGAASALQAAPPPGLDGAVVCAGRDCVIWCQHWAEAATASEGPGNRLAGIADPQLDSKAQAVKAPPTISWTSPGLRIAPGTALNLRFERRAATPW